MKKWLLLGGVVVILGAAVAGQVYMNKHSKPVYSSVILDNNQVYFGILKGNKLTDAYTLQVNASSTPQLIKVTSSLHVPTDEIDFNPQHILYTQTLDNSSPVVAAIKK